MGWPRKDEPMHTKHWPSPEKNALGQVTPICKHTGSYYMKPEMAKRPEDVTCGVCKRWARRMQ